MAVEVVSCTWIKINTDVFAEHEFNSDSKVCRQLHALDFFFIQAGSLEYMILISYALFNGSSGISVEVDPICGNDVEIGVYGDSDVVLAVADVGLCIFQDGAIHYVEIVSFEQA